MTAETSLMGDADLEARISGSLHTVLKEPAAAPPSSFEPHSASFATHESNTVAAHENGTECCGFPTEELPAVARNFVYETSRALQVPEGMVAPLVLSAISTTLGSKLRLLTHGDQSVSGNVFSVTVSPSGTGKSLSFHDCYSPIVEYENEQINRWSRERFPHLRAEMQLLEAQKKRLLKKNFDPESTGNDIEQLAEIERKIEALERDRQPKLFCQDVTREKLAELLAHDPCEAMASVSPDARGIISVLKGRYSSGSSDEDIYLAAYSGDSYKQDRLNRPSVHLRSPCLVVHWMIQEDVWEEFLRNDIFMKSGLLPRFLISAQTFDLQAIPESPIIVAPATKNTYRERLHELLREYRFARDPSYIEVPVAPVVRSLFRAFENDLRLRRNSEGDLHDLNSFAARWTENAWRLTLILHAAQHGSSAHRHPVSGDTGRAALTIQNWFNNEQLRMLRPHRKKNSEEGLDRLARVLSRYPAGSASLRDLKNSSGISSEEIERIAREFPGVVTISTRANPAGGRPSKVVSISQIPHCLRTSR